MTLPLRRDALLKLKVESDLARAVEVTARQRGQTTSEFVRQSVRAHIARYGVRLNSDDRPAPIAPEVSAAALKGTAR